MKLGKRISRSGMRNRKQNRCVPSSSASSNKPSDNVASIINKENVNILTQQGYYVLPISIGAYIILQGLTHIQQVCIAEEYGISVSYYYFGAGFAFSVNVLLSGKKVLEHHVHRGLNGEFRGMAFVAATTISTIAGTASFLTSNANYGGVCVDILGVSSPAAQWSEWLVCVPLMTYMIVSMEQKPALTLGDYTIILLMGFSVLVGFLMNLPVTFGGGVFLFIFGCLCLIGVLVFVMKGRESVVPTSNDYLTNDQITAKKYQLLAQTNRRNNLTLLIATVFPIFPLIYLLGWIHILDRDQVAIGYIMVSLIAKLLFVSTLLDAQVHLTDSMEIQRQTEKLAQDSRRDFLRYVFHELRIPLNTLTIGIGLLLEDNDALQNTYREALRMMNGAANLMSDTLNDVLFMHKIDEGAMEISKTAFVLEDVFRESVKTINAMLDEKHISILFETTIDRADAMPLEEGEIVLMGDQLRLESVLTNFLTHAVKVSPTHSQIKVVIKMKVGRVMTLTSGKAESTASIPSLPPLSPLLGNTETGGQRVAGGGGSGAGGGSGTSKGTASSSPRGGVQRGRQEGYAQRGRGGSLSRHPSPLAGRMQSSNEEYGSTNNLLKCVEKDSPGPCAESISPAAPVVPGNASVRGWLDVECGGGASGGGGGGGASGTGSGSPFVKNDKKIGSDESKRNSFHRSSEEKPLPGGNNLPSNNGMRNQNDNTAQTGKGRPPSRKGSLEISGFGGFGSFIGRSNSQRRGSDPSGYFLQICDTTLTITDASQGLSTQEMACLLNPYGTIRPESHDVEEQGRSTGLWLVIVKRIIGLHKGTLIAESHKGMGTTFGFQIPFEVAPACTDKQLRAVASLRQINRHQSKDSITGNGNDRNIRSISPRERIGQGFAQLGKPFQSSGRISTANSPKNSAERRERRASNGLLPSFNPIATTRRATSPPATTRRTSQILLTEKKSPRGPSNRSLLLATADHVPELTLEGGQNVMLGGSQEVVSNGSPSVWSPGPAGGGGGVDIILPPVESPDNNHNHNNNNNNNNNPSSILPHPTNPLPSPTSSPRQATKPSNVNDDPTKVWDYHFLIVDDTPSNRRMLQMVLNKRNIHCDVAQDGKEAVDIVADHGDRYDFIFMDFTMPIMNGAQATAAIRKLGFDRLIFGLSGNALDDDRKTFLAAGANCVIPKPFRMAQLDALMKYIVNYGFKADPSISFVLEEGKGDVPCNLRILKQSS